jgi:hypothetical protein
MEYQMVIRELNGREDAIMELPRWIAEPEDSPDGGVAGGKLIRKCNWLDLDLCRFLRKITLEMVDLRPLCEGSGTSK